MSSSQPVEPESPEVSTAELEDAMAALLLGHNTATKTTKEVVMEMKADIAALASSKGYETNQSAKLQKACGWYSPAAMYYAGHPFRLARGEFTAQLINEHKGWICSDWMDGNFKVLDYACGDGLASRAFAPHVRLIMGVDEARDIVDMYNEIAKRLAHPTCVMRAYLGDLMPDMDTGEDRGFAYGYQYPNAYPTLGMGADSDITPRTASDFENFDLVVVSLAIDCFEILNVGPMKRKLQLIANLQAIIKRMKIGGTLLIIDVQQVADVSESAMPGSTNGFKAGGYHSREITEALEILGMDDVEVIDNERFKWKATTEDTKMGPPFTIDQPFFMLRATKTEGFKNWTHEKWAELEIEANIRIMEMLEDEGHIHHYH